MIRIRLKGRLGNQLFIYAFARSLMERYHQPALIYDRKKEADSKWYSHLDGYRLHPDVKFTSDSRHMYETMGITDKLLWVYDRIRIRSMMPRERWDFQRHHQAKYLRHGMFLLMDGYMELPAKISGEIFCDGYFQSAKYFDAIRPKILEELQPKEPHTAKEQAYIHRIASCNSVCLTIRLGDYINNATHQVCTREFFLKAMRRMREMEPGCEFFAFSDEPEKVSEFLQTDLPIHFDCMDAKDYMSLDIMAHCRHFIISNSSFSWWAQYLANDPRKKVIAPSRWYAEDVPCDIMQPSWILLDC